MKSLEFIKNFDLNGNFHYLTDRGYIWSWDYDKNIYVNYSNFQNGTHNYNTYENFSGLLYINLNCTYFLTINGLLSYSINKEADKFYYIDKTKNFCSIRSIEEIDLNLTYILIQDNNYYLNYYENNKFLWKIYGKHIKNVCILSNGNCIIRDDNNIISVLDKNDGNNILSRRIINIKKIHNFHQYGLLILFDNNELSLYDNNLNLLNKLINCYDIISTSKFGLVCLQTIEDKYYINISTKYPYLTKHVSLYKFEEKSIV